MLCSDMCMHIQVAERSGAHDLLSKQEWCRPGKNRWVQGTTMRWLSVMQALELLSLSEDILQRIAWHFTLKEWVKGPAHTCRLLHSLELKRVDLEHRKFLEVHHTISPHASFCVCLFWRACSAAHTQ